MDDNYPIAMVREIDGQLILDDPEAVAIIRAIEKNNCQNTLALNLDRIEHFKKRLMDLKLSSDNAVIVIINVDDVHGGILADNLMPGNDWQSIRDRGEIPFARGLAGKSGIEEYLSIFDQEAADKLKTMNDLAVVVVDRGVAEVFLA